LFVTASKFGLINHKTFSEGNKVENSSIFSGLKVEDARSKILEKAKEMKVGGYLTSSKLNDW